MGKLIHKDQIGAGGDDGPHVQVGKGGAAVDEHPWPYDLQPAELRFCFGVPAPLDPANHDALATISSPLALSQHGVGLAHAGAVPR